MDLLFGTIIYKNIQYQTCALAFQLLERNEFSYHGYFSKQN